LANGHFKLDGQTLSLRHIRIPTFVVGTVKDHVSPWRSVYKLHGLVSGPVTFALTNGGHNAGIISEPGHHGRHFQLMTTSVNQPRLSADDWLAAALPHEGSWWNHWSHWMVEHGSGRELAARVPSHSTKLGKAPGHYVKTCYAD
jgi:polyhydroxyalkanoate synthase